MDKEQELEIVIDGMSKIIRATEKALINIDKNILDINKKLDYIIQLVLPRLSELQETEIKHELFPNTQKEFDYNLDDITTPPEDFNANTDSIINENKLI